jgi:MarR family 2-MHQ and catechol resistance regulon transcriptional repressor
MAASPDHRTAALAAYVKLLRAERAIIARLEPSLAREGLTLTQFGVLEALWHKGPLTQGELSRKVLTSPPNLTDVVARLALRGLVRRERESDDRRRVRVTLTPEGEALIARLFPQHAEEIAAAMQALSTCELRLLEDLLRRLGHGACAAPLPLAEPAASP